MKFIIFSDAHLHPHRFGATHLENGRNSRLQHGLDVLEETARVARAEGATARLFPGDLFHVRGQIKPSVQNPVIDHLDNQHAGPGNDADFEDHWIPGNHDMEHRNEGEHALAAMCRPGVHVYDSYGYKPQAITSKHGDTCAIGWVSYAPDVKTLKQQVEQVAAQARLDTDSTYKVMLIHHGVDGAMPNIPDMGFAPQHLPTDDFTAIFCGDYHNHKQLADNAWMVGAPMQQNFGDVGQKRGYMVVELGKRGVESAQLREVPGIPKFVSWDQHAKKKDAPAAADLKGNFVRVRADDENVLEKMRQIVEQHEALAVQAELVRDWKAIERSDVQLSMTTRELFKTWLDGQDLNGLEVDPLVKLNDEILTEAGVS